MSMSETKRNVKEIWIVDDDFDMQALARVILEREGFRVATFADGFSVLKQLEKQKPELILLDIMMPGISGLETLKEIRAQHPIRSLPILMLTAVSLPTNVDAFLQIEANDYITKPYSKGDLLERVLLHATVPDEELTLEETPPEPDPAGRPIRAVLANAWIIVTFALLGLTAAYLYVSNLTPLYQSEAYVALLIPAPEGADVAAYVDSLEPGLGDTIATGYRELLLSAAVREAAFNSLTSRYDLQILQESIIDIASTDNRLIIRIAVTSADPLLARDLANEMAQQIKVLSPAPEVIDPFSVSVIREAAESLDPVVPRTIPSLLFATGGSISVGAMLIFAVERFRKPSR